MLQIRWFAALAMGLCLGLTPVGFAADGRQACMSLSAESRLGSIDTERQVLSGKVAVGDARSQQLPALRAAEAGYDAEALEGFLLSTILAHAVVGMRAASINLKGLTHN